MIKISKTYHLALTEQQAKELYFCLKRAKDDHFVTAESELILVYDELKKLFGVGIR